MQAFVQGLRGAATLSRHKPSAAAGPVSLETGLGAEVGYRLCFLLFSSCCLLPNEAPAICER